MNSKRVLGLILLIGGIVLVGISVYIKQQVAAGNLQITEAESKVDSANKLFSLTPETKQIGQQFTGSANKKISAGKEEVAQYTQYANWCMVGGIILIVVGGGIMIFGGRKKYS